MVLVGVCSRCFSPVHMDHNIIFQTCRHEDEILKRSYLYYHYIFPNLFRLALVGVVWIFSPEFAFIVGISLLVMIPPILADNYCLDKNTPVEIDFLFDIDEVTYIFGRATYDSSRHSENVVRFDSRKK